MKENIFLFILISFLISNRLPSHIGVEQDEPIKNNSLYKIGDNPIPTNPMNDRAKGYILDGKIKSAIANYGNFIDWRYTPAGLWGNYAYLPHIGFIAGVPGNSNSVNFIWSNRSIIENEVTKEYWASSELYNEWFIEEYNYKGIAYNIENDTGDACKLSENFENEIFITFEDCIYFIDHDQNQILLYLNTEFNDPNLSISRVGLIYPWAYRPSLIERMSEFDLYDYGPDQEEWTEDDDYKYYGYSTSESWFSEGLYTNTDWQPTTKSRENSHNIDVSAGDIFGNTQFTDINDTYPLLAHSKYTDTWPKSYNSVTGQYEPFWPGWWSEEYYGNRVEEWAENGITNCNQTRKDPDCWKEVPGRFVSDTDIYMEFDDRWAHRGNLVEDNQYIQTGYPLGLKVRAEAHSYGVAYAEDIMFITVKLRNESGGWYDDNGEYHQGLVLPDGTRINGGSGFDYKDMYLGFYFDSIVVWADYLLNYGVWSNTDDYMEYYWDKIYHEGDSLLISLAMTYDYDGSSNGATDIGLVAAQLLDTPLATKEVDLNMDGITDIFPGEPLKMTDWHWFDWYNRPGVVDRESGTNCCAGYAGRPQARNKEEIHYKLMAGDTTNLSDDEKQWFFHTANPDLDSDLDLNPHFDSLDGLQSEPVFQQGQEGFDCIFIMSSGPFDIKVGEEVPFSFCIIFGENKEDLIANAEFAQLMYNSRYQGFTAPETPNVTASFGHNQITLKWNPNAIYSKDVLTGYSDFEGYKIYKSLDGGQNWGGPQDKIYDDNGIFVGWHPYAQFDLTAKEDSMHCLRGFENESTCYNNEFRDQEFSGPDPYAPWFSLGTNSGLPNEDENGYFTFIDTNVVDGIEYTYSVTSYDIGISPEIITFTEEGNQFTSDTTFYANPDGWARPNGYQSIESAKGTTIHDQNFIKIIAGYEPQSSLNNINVVPNPYIAHSDFNETQYMRKLRFTNLPEKCTITIFTINGEKVNSINHESVIDGNAWWNLRTINNQEVAPGLYIFTVESGKEKFVGKFAVIR